MTKHLLLITVFCVTNLSLYCQTAGAKIYAGATSMANRDINITPDGSMHTGHHLGIDARINAGKLFFLGGIRYTAVEFTATNKAQYIKNDTNLNLINGRFGLGFGLIDLQHWILIRAKVLGSIGYISNYDEVALNANPVGYRTLNDAYAGLILGLGFDLINITVDLEYDYSIVNTFNSISGSKFDGLSLSLGFFF